jgi:hypothetical protein
MPAGCWTGWGIPYLENLPKTLAIIYEAGPVEEMDNPASNSQVYYSTVTERVCQHTYIRNG